MDYQNATVEFHQEIHPLVEQLVMHSFVGIENEHEAKMFYQHFNPLCQEKLEDGIESGIVDPALKEKAWTQPIVTLLGVYFNYTKVIVSRNATMKEHTEKMVGLVEEVLEGGVK